MVKLNRNDIIGLGCSNMDPSNDTLYTYKVCTIESSPLDTGESSVLSTTVLNSNTPPTISTSPAERTIGKKYGIDTDCDTEVPKKKLKDIDRNIHSSKVTLSKANSSATNNSVETRSPIVDIETEDDIEIIHTALTKEIKNQDYNCKSAKYLDSNNKSNFNEKMDIIIDENYKDDGDSNKNISNIDVEEENLSSSDKTNEALNLPKNLSVVHSEDQIIILEDQITDDDEEESIGAVNMTCDTSLIKLKKIKHEPKTRFSEIDVIDLSDDEEGVFPCSQLFDIKYEDNTENGREIKQECINNDDQNIEKIGLDVDDEVIFLTDSEDEDNPWLERLSRSQLFNEDKKSDPNNAVVKGEIDLGIWDEDDILNINTSVGDKSKKSENINNNDSNSNNNLLTTELEAMNVNDVGLPNESSSKNTDDANKRKINDDAELDTELDKQTLHVESTKQKLATKKSVTRLKRLIPVIEPLNLPVRRRIDCSKNKTHKVTEKSSSKLRIKRMSELKEKTNDNFYIKNQEHREKPHKSMADCHSPSEKKAISKDERKIILEKRKMKLKELAEEKNKLSAKSDQNIKKDRRTNTAKAKVSLKNRGDFLIIEQESSSTSLLDKSTNVPKSNNNQFKERLTDKADVLKKSSTSDVETQKSHQKDDVSKDTINSIVSSLKQSLQLDNTNAIQVPKDSKHDSKVTGDREKRGSSSKEKRSNKNVKISEQNRSTEYDPAVAQKENFSSNSVKLSCKLKRKKKVTFVEKSEIREYEIDRCNSLRKLVGKDAPIPVNKLRTSTTSAECSPKLEEFLLRIFKWNPVWLEEQRYLKSEPPIVSHCELHTMRLNYDSYKQYYKIAMPLLLLEVWCTMTKEFEMIEKNKQRATMMCSVVEKSTCTPIPSTNLFLTTLKLEVLVKKEDLSKQVHPVYGDLVYFEYVTNVHGKQTVNRIFAYVTNMYQTVITNLTHYNQDLKNYVKNPYAVIMYTLLTRPLQHDIPVNRVQRVRTVMYLRANIRMVQALQYLPQSPLLELILNPKIKEYQMPPMDEKFTCSSLVTRDNLNPKQLEAVFRVTETVLRKETKLCFIQGPPGTGKSKVIANLVTQILYGEHTNRKSLRILVCAPSNAAIDEIVLRLLDIRSKLKKKRFNMVRIGRLECMHSMTKPISVTELAKRHLAKMIQEAACSDSTEIAILKARINSLQAELASSQKVDEVKKKELRRKLMETSMRHDLLNCGKSANEFSAKEHAKYQRLAENIILTGADIIACTLSSCYTNQMESIFGGYKEKISVCIVDEATQSCEAETLIPLMLGVKTLVLVGDPNQLPATILSQQAKKLGLDQSIFSRIQNVFTSQQNSPIIMLNTQYRMDYAISYWPNKYFYDGKLKSAIEFKTRFPFHSYRLLNHDFTQNDDKFSNTIEAEFVANLIFAMLMFANWESIDATISLGVLTPYNNQRTLILNKINEKISPISDNLKKKINFEVNTVDSFQGQERDVIIMSCVRSHGIGFLSDRQRLCVALTRAKHSLILCGNFNTFLKDQMWNALLSDAQSRGVLCHVDANATPAIIKQFIIK
ncbi:helicase senataxin [Lasius niger]|uniref:Helicase senataxin n=1 Tax=Lasius niger TaxID=67767 RepID=A0A0J7KNB2_LASNI|nr:helicase senataxin [Lasius niger]